MPVLKFLKDIRASAQSFGWESDTSGYVPTPPDPPNRIPINFGVQQPTSVNSETFARHSTLGQAAAGLAASAVEFSDSSRIDNFINDALSSFQDSFVSRIPHEAEVQAGGSAGDWNFNVNAKFNLFKTKAEQSLSASCPCASISLSQEVSTSEIKNKVRAIVGYTRGRLSVGATFNGSTTNDIDSPTSDGDLDYNVGAGFNYESSDATVRGGASYDSDGNIRAGLRGQARF